MMKKRKRPCDRVQQRKTQKSFTEFSILQADSVIYGIKASTPDATGSSPYLF